VLRVVQKLAHVNVINDVCLSGGVFQNDYLLEKTEAGIRALGYNVYSNVAVPLNDGGISLGQAHILRAKLKAGNI